MPPTHDNVNDHDANLLECASSGDVAVFGDLHEQYAAEVRRVAEGLLRRKGLGAVDVDDIVQETILRFLANPPATAEKLGGWLATVCRNLVSEYWRKQRLALNTMGSEVLAALQGNDPDPSDLLENADQGRHLKRMIADLPPSYRAVIEDRLNDVPIVETAARLGVSPNSVYIRCSRAINELRSMLLPASGEGETS